MRSGEWDYQTNQISLIDQRLLSGEFRINVYGEYQEVACANSNMVVHGTPAIRATAAFGLALAAFSLGTYKSIRLTADLINSTGVLSSARPTAVNHSLASRIVLDKTSSVQESVDDIQSTILKKAQHIANEDVEVNKHMAKFGAALIDDGGTLIHHCITRAQATVG